MKMQINPRFLIPLAGLLLAGLTSSVGFAQLGNQGTLTVTGYRAG
jgi:hypothetical protein